MSAVKKEAIWKFVLFCLIETFLEKIEKSMKKYCLILVLNQRYHYVADTEHFI